MIAHPKAQRADGKAKALGVLGSTSGQRGGHGGGAAELLKGGSRMPQSGSKGGGVLVGAALDKRPNDNSGLIRGNSSLMD